MARTNNFRGVSIDNFEQRCDPKAVAKGERMYTDQDLRLHQEKEPGLFSAMIQTEQGSKNVEVWLKKSSVRSASCECHDFRVNKNICEHIIASLYALRAHFTAKQLPPSPFDNPPELPTLHLNHLLAAMSHNDLISFIKHSIRDNKDLGTVLKLKYAHLITIENNDQKYETILQGMFRPFMSGTINISTFKKLSGWLEEGVAVGADLIVMGHWKEAVLLLTAISRKIHYLAYRKPEQKEQLQKINHLWFISLRKLVGLSLPPEVKHFIKERLEPLAISPHYKTIHYEENVHLLLWVYFWSITEQESHLTLLAKRIHLELDFRQQHFFCTWHLDPSRALHLLNSLEWPASELANIAVYFMTHKERKEADQVIAKLLEPQYSPWIQEKIIDYLTTNKCTISPLISEPFWHHLKQKPKLDAAIHLWESGASSQALMLQSLEEQKDERFKRIQVITAILAKHGSWLRQNWSEDFNPATIKPLIPLLLDRWDAEDVIALIHGVVLDYLQSHLGDQPLQLVRELLDYFYHRNAGPVAKTLKDLVKQSYPERYGIYQW